MKLTSAFLALSTIASIGAAQTPAALAPASDRIAASAATPVPSLVPYSGVVVAADGKPLSGTSSLTFLIFKEEQGGEPLWAETQAVLLDNTGHYNTHLGASNNNGLPADLFATGEARWLEVQIAGEKPQPRVLLASVPYALKSADAATLGGLPASAFALAGSLAPTGALNTPGITPDGTTNVTTSGGISGYVPVFTGTSAIANSVLFQNANGIGIKSTNPGAALDVAGKSIFRGGFELTRSANATASAGTSSYPISLYVQAYNSSSKTNVNPFFELMAEPTSNNTSSPGAALHLLYDSGSGNPAETGFYLNKDGTIHFATGQTFPAGSSGSGTITGVTAGTGLTGGGTSGNVTLKINTSTVPTLSGNNSFTGSNTFVPSLYEDTDINIDNTNANSGGISPGLRFGSASGEGIASKRTSGSNQYGLNFYTDYQSRMSISAAGQVAIGTGSTFDGSQLQVQGATGIGGEFLGGVTSDTSGDAQGEPGVIATGGNTSSNSGTYSQAGSGIIATGGSASSSSVIYTFGGDGGDFQGGTASNAGCCYEGGAAGDSPAPLPYTGSGIISMGGFAASGQPGYGAVLVGGSTNTGTPGEGLYVISGTDANSNQAGSATFNGDVNIAGTLNADVKNFKIDHPVDPAKKYLVHTSIESSEMVNIYSGNVTTDELGLATVQLPDWFEVENGDFRYQLTVMGERFAEAIVSKKIANHQFTIHTNASQVEVSWQVTGVRQDAYAKAHPLHVEETKPTREQGFYLHPELFGQPAQKQIQWARQPGMMQHLQQTREQLRLKPRAQSTAPLTTRPTLLAPEKH